MLYRQGHGMSAKSSMWLWLQTKSAFDIACKLFLVCEEIFWLFVFFYQAREGYIPPNMWHRSVQSHYTCIYDISISFVVFQNVCWVVGRASVLSLLWSGWQSCPKMKSFQEHKDILTCFPGWTVCLAPNLVARWKMGRVYVSVWWRHSRVLLQRNNSGCLDQIYFLIGTPFIKKIITKQLFVLENK